MIVLKCGAMLQRFVLHFPFLFALDLSVARCSWKNFNWNEILVPEGSLTFEFGPKKLKSGLLF